MRRLPPACRIAAVAAALLGGGMLQPGAATAQDFCSGDRVMGGCAVSIRDFPWMVSISQAQAPDRFAGHICGGSVIADRWVLTAAHCVEMVDPTAPRGLAVYSGSASLSGGGALHDVETVYIHPGYSGMGQDDIALVETARPMGIAPVRRATEATAPELEAVGLTTVLTGWGLTPPEHIARGRGPLTAAERGSDAAPADWDTSPALLGASVPVVDPALCGQPGSDRIVCAGFETAVADACRGDSGGPLHGIDAEGYVQVGLVSGGNYCHQDGAHWGSYSRVAAYADWIDATLAGETDPYAFVGAGPDLGLPPTFGTVTLVAGRADHAEELLAGGLLRAQSVGGTCVGHIAQAPDFQVVYQSGRDLPLQFEVASQADTTLAINLPDGSWACDDDSAGNLQPRITLAQPASGRYDVFVGTYRSYDEVGYPPARLSVANPGGATAGAGK